MKQHTTEVNNITKLTVALLLLLGTGCATNQKIKYSLRDVTPSKSQRFENATLDVKSFQNRRPIPGGLTTKSVFAVGPGVVHKEDGSKWFFNSDNYYKEDIALQIPKMMTKHIYASGLFKSSTFEGGPADYTLEGVIKNFDSYKEVDDKATAGAYLGLIGSLSTAGVKSKYFVHVYLIQMELSDARGNLVWAGDIETKLEGEDYADCYGWSSYIKANEALKTSTDKLIKELMEL